MEAYLGVDVGSVSTNLALVTGEGQVLQTLYLRTQGKPVQVVQEGLKTLEGRAPEGLRVAGAGTTGSARQLVGVVIGADVVKNEITAHATAALHLCPDVRTVFEIGGQDSKIIILRDGIVVDFAMNTICAAGTGSFLDHQATRLAIPIERFGDLALAAQNPVRIAGRCGVFAESDMIHKQQEGHRLEDIIAGLCDALVRNYLNNVGKGKDIRPPVYFQGGVAANAGLRHAFGKAMGYPVIVPEHHLVMGAIGAALLARDAVARNRRETTFRGWAVSGIDCATGSLECQGCPNRCEVVQVWLGGEIIARWGDRCGKWSNLPVALPAV
jgi:predicted CoA-substrate-specific enzyme activase